MRNVKLSTLVGIAGILACGAAAGQVQTSPGWNGSVHDAAGEAAAKAELVLQGNGNRYSAVATESGRASCRERVYHPV